MRSARTMDTSSTTSASSVEYSGSRRRLAPFAFACSTVTPGLACMKRWMVSPPTRFSAAMPVGARVSVLAGAWWASQWLTSVDLPVPALPVRKTTCGPDESMSRAAGSKSASVSVESFMPGGLRPQKPPL